MARSPTPHALHSSQFPDNSLAGQARLLFPFDAGFVISTLPLSFSQNSCPLHQVHRCKERFRFSRGKAFNSCNLTSAFFVPTKGNDKVGVEEQRDDQEVEVGLEDIVKN